MLLLPLPEKSEIQQPSLLLLFKNKKTIENKYFKLIAFFEMGILSFKIEFIIVHGELWES